MWLFRRYRNLDIRTWFLNRINRIRSPLHTHKPQLFNNIVTLFPKKKKNYKHSKSQRIFNIQSQKQINKTTNFFFNGKLMSKIKISKRVRERERERSADVAGLRLRRNNPPPKVMSGGNVVVVARFKESFKGNNLLNRLRFVPRWPSHSCTYGHVGHFFFCVSLLIILTLLL